MGLSATRISEPTRRDRLLLVSAFATALLTLLGAVGESLGMDRLLKSNTSTKRTHSLFRQRLHALRPHTHPFQGVMVGPSFGLGLRAGRGVTSFRPPSLSDLSSGRRRA